MERLEETRTATDDRQDRGDESDRLRDENALLREALADARQRLAEMEGHSEQDPLTGLANERQFLVQLERFVSATARHSTPAALLTIELSRLRAINEQHGHVAGDAALIHVAGLLKTLIRGSDVVARTEGAVFSLLLDHLDGDSAIETGERITRCIAANPLDLGRAQISLDASVAVATILPGDRAEDVLQRSVRNRRRVKEFR